MTELDRGAIAGARRGDAVAFRRLVEVYHRRVHALCAALAGADAEDLVQETFVRVHQALPRFDPEGPPLGAWILTIARRLCTDRARGARVRLEVVGPPPEAVGVEDPARTLEARDLQARLCRAFEALPAEQRTALALFEWEDVPYHEIAAIEGVPVGTVRSRIARARDALRAALAMEEARDR